MRQIAAVDDRIPLGPSSAEEPERAHVPENSGEAAGVEDEDPVLSSGEITDPFDPARIRIRTKVLLVQQLATRLQEDEINLAPDFQRRLVWMPRQKTRLIESLLLKIPLPVFYVASDQDDDWDVVDGIQRMSTIRDYLDGRFPLDGLEYLTQFAGSTYSQLPRRMQRRILETELLVNIIEYGTPPEVMFNIFTRINTGGTPLRAQEIRHALYRGAWRGFLRDLAEGEPFLTATCRSIGKARMADRECILRFVAFYMNPWENYDTGDLDGRLRDAIEIVNRAERERIATVRADFDRAMHAAFEIFGNLAFRKVYPGDRSRRPVNRALFEAWSVQLARCTQKELQSLISRRSDLINAFKAKLSTDVEFERSVSAGTADPRRVRIRFGTVQGLIEEYAS